MKITCGLLCVAFGLFLGAPQSKASTSFCAGNPNNLIGNCAFGTGDFTDWTVTGNDTPGEAGNLYGVETGADPVDGIIPPNGDTNQAFFADLVANSTTIAETLNTTPGVIYTIEFYMAQDTTPGTGTAPNSNQLVLSFGGTTVTTLTATPVQGYTFYKFTGTATGAFSVVSFTIGNDLGETLLDDISVTTPEPSTWMLMGAGLLGLAFVARKRTA
ncbi:MAG: PEP-CTERM sorting domain-containing protein [Bryobacteraceae bacterium]